MSTGIQPGQGAYFALGTWECCVFLVPYPACAEWTVEPAGSASITLIEDPSTPLGKSYTGLLQVEASVPAGTVIVLRADVESGRRILEARTVVYTPESNPLVGFWEEKAQVTCAGYLAGDFDGGGQLDISDAIGIFSFLFRGDRPPACRRAIDANADGKDDIADGIFILAFLFQGGRPPPAPYPACTVLSPDDPPDPDCPPTPACPGTDIVPVHPILELAFEANGEFSVTWTPFEVYRDYWGTYSFDLASGTISLQVERGNYIPPDIPESGRIATGAKFRVEGRTLILEGVWLGSYHDAPVVPPPCGHRFERPSWVPGG